MAEQGGERGYDAGMNVELFFGHPGMFVITVSILVLAIASVIVTALVAKMYIVLHKKQHTFMTSLGAGHHPACRKSLVILLTYACITVITSVVFLLLFFLEPHAFS